MSEAAHLVQVVLPATPASRELLSETRQELVSRFKAVTAYRRSPADSHGIGSSGVDAQDDAIVVEVLVDDFDGEWWCIYGELLAIRFGVDSIQVRALTATVPKRPSPEA